MDAGPRGGPLVRRVLTLAVILGSLGGLAWLVATEHDQLGRALAGVAHAKLSLVVAAVFCERVSMIAFARSQVRLLRAGGHRMNLLSAIAIVFAGNALSVSVPIAGPGLAVAFTYRELERRQISRPAAAFALVVSGVLSTVTLIVVIAAGALASGDVLAAVAGLVAVIAVAAGIAGAVLGLRVPACRRFCERTAIRGLRTAPPGWPSRSGICSWSGPRVSRPAASASPRAASASSRWPWSPPWSASASPPPGPPSRS